MDLWGAVWSLEERVVDPVLCRVLRSPVHWPASRWYCLVRFEDDEGRVTETAVPYSRANDIVHVVAVREYTTWWRHFRDPAACTLHVAGETRSAVGEVVTNAVKHEAHVTRFLHPTPALSGPGGEGALDTGDLTNYVLVEFSLDDSVPADAGDHTRIPVEPE